MSVLTRSVNLLFYYENDKEKAGRNPILRGDCSGLSGDCTGLRGDCDGIPMEERKTKPRIEDWVINNK